MKSRHLFKMSIIKRFIYSYIFNIVSMIFTFITGLYLANTLGPSDYGTYAYMVAFFGGVFYLLDLGSSSAFFTFLSKNNKNFKFFMDYSFFLIFILLFVLIFFLLAPNYLIENLSLINDRSILIVAIAAIFLRNSVWNLIRKIYESQRLSISINLINALASIFYFILIFCFDNFSGLNIFIVFKIILAEFLILSIIVFFVNPIRLSSNKDSTSSLKQYFLYCLPIAPSIFFLGFVKMIEPWLIVAFGGLEQQAFFSISLQFTMVMVLVLSSIINIFWKELAENIENDNFAKAGELYTQSLKYLYLFMCFCSFFLFFQTENIVKLFLEEEYIEAVLTMQVLFLYPCIQVFGQINGVVLLAAEKTSLYSKYQFLQGLLAVLISYFGLIYITDFFGSLISVSNFMALKTLFVATIFMLVMTRKIKKFFSIDKSFNFILFIPLAVLVFNFVIYSISTSVTDIFGFNNNLLINILFNGLLLLVSLLYLLFKHPSLLLISKEDSIMLYKKLKL